MIAAWKRPLDLGLTWAKRWNGHETTKPVQLISTGLMGILDDF